MNITNRLYTYPVLSSEKDDYNTSSFNVKSRHEMAGVNTLRLNFDIELNCAELQKLLNRGDAQYMVHIECSSTAFRQALFFQTLSLQHDIEIRKLNGLLEMVVFIIATKNIRHFKCNDWNDDFFDMEFDIEKGSVLAYQNLNSLNIEKDYEELSNVPSIFLIFRRETEETKAIEVNMESDKIKIGLGINEYSVYKTFCKRTEMQPILNSMIILPALVYVFEELMHDEGIERYRNRHWFQALETSYEKRGLNLESEILNQDKRSIILAQEAMEYPINNGLIQMKSAYSEMYAREDDEE